MRRLFHLDFLSLKAWLRIRTCSRSPDVSSCCKRAPIPIWLTSVDRMIGFFFVEMKGQEWRKLFSGAREKQRPC